MSKKVGAIFIIVFLSLMIVPLASAGFFGDAWQWVTGLATSGPTNVSVALGNTAPEVIHVSSIGTITPRENTTVSVNISFLGYDAEGTSNLDNGTAVANITVHSQSGSVPVYSNTSCTPAVDPIIDANTINYTCMFTMWYFDYPDYWNITATIQDINAAAGTNGSVTFNYDTLTAIQVSPETITWTSVTAGANNETPSNWNTINNTGNDNVSTVQVRAINLIGVGDPAYHMAAENFSGSSNNGGSPPAECNYEQTSDTALLQNFTYVTVPGAGLYRGNHTLQNGTGQENIYYCITNISSGLFSQSYTTGVGGPWYLQIVT